LSPEATAVPVQADSQPSARRTRVFLSYSRKDQPFVIRLSEALEGRGYFVDYDQGADADKIEGGIAPTDAWWDRLKANIAVADVVIFAVSPAAIASRVCDDEIAEAQRLGKRLIPFLVSEIDFANAPPRLATLNIAISFAGGMPFEDCLERLCAAIETDIQWLREGRRLTEQAIEWQAAPQPGDRVLLGAAIRAAEAWALRRPANAPPPSDIVLAFISASRDDETRRLAEERRRLARVRRNQRIAGAALFVVALVLTLAIVGFDRVVSTQSGRASDAMSLAARGAAADQQYDRALRIALAGVHGSQNLFGGYHDTSALAELRHAMAAISLRLVLRGHVGSVRYAAFSPDGTRIVTASDDKTARIWDAATGRQIRVLAGHTGAIWHAAFSLDGTRVVTASYDETARIWDSATGRQLLSIAGRDEFSSAEFSPDGRRVVTASVGEGVRIWDAGTGKLLISMYTGDYNVAYDARFLPDGTRVLTASNNGEAGLYDAATGAEIQVYRTNLQRMFRARPSPDATRIVTASEDGTFRVFDAATRTEQHEETWHRDAVHDAVFSPDGKLIASASSDGAAAVWDSRSWRQVAILAGHTSSVQSAEFSKDGTRIVTASGDGTARVWAIAPMNSPVPLLAGHTDSVNVAAISPDGTRIVTGSDDHSARIWDAGASREVAILKGHTDKIRDASFSADGTRVVTASEDGTARIWDAATGRAVAVINAKGGRISSARFAPNGARVLTSSAVAIELWDASTGVKSAVLPGQGDENWVKAVFSPDGTRIAAVSNRPQAQVWDVATARGIATLKHGYDNWSSAVAFSPDGSRVVTASADGDADIWETATGRRLAALKGHVNRIGTIAYSFDGARVLTASNDNSARIWDANSGHELAVLWHTAGVNAAVFSADGTRIVTASEDTTARIWDAASAREIASFPHEGSRVVIPNGEHYKAGLVRAVAFLPGSARVVTGTYGGTVSIWQVPAAVLSDRTTLERDACALASSGHFSELSDAELADLPFLNPVRERDPCKRASLWIRTLDALGIESGTSRK
jgi:WD40 repeat protein